MTDSAAIASALVPSPAVSAPARSGVVVARIKRTAGFSAVAARFKITEFVNPRTGSVSYRVTGSRRDGVRVRENFASAAAAQARQLALETEFLGSHQQTVLQATALTPDQLRLAEVAYLKLGDDWKLILDAVDQYRRNGRTETADVPRLDVAVTRFKTWLETCPLRTETRRGLRVRITMFGNSMENRPVNEFRPEHIDAWLDRLTTGAVDRDNHRRAVSRFFSWGMERARRWLTVNPCVGVKVAKPERTEPPAILTLDQCTRLLAAAMRYRDGLLVPYVAVCLFAGLRPFEARRLVWAKVGLKEREIRIEKHTSKVGTSRVVEISPLLGQWLRRYSRHPFFPKNWRKHFAAVRALAGLTEWPPDVLRHTAISHHFRKHTSYGLAAEQFGNSERIIKADYQGRVNKAETKLFYRLSPKTVSSPKSGLSKGQCPTSKVGDIR